MRHKKRICVLLCRQSIIPPKHLAWENGGSTWQGLCWNSNSKLVNRKIQFCDCSSPSDFGRHCTSADQELCCASTTWHLLHRIRRTKQKNSQEVACLCQTLFKVKQNKKSYPWIQPPLYTSWSSNAVVLHVIRDVLSGKKKASAHDARKLVKMLRACVIFYRVE